MKKYSVSERIERSKRKKNEEEKLEEENNIYEIENMMNKWISKV